MRKVCTQPIRLFQGINAREFAKLSCGFFVVKKTKLLSLTAVMRLGQSSGITIEGSTENIIYSATKQESRTFKTISY